MKKNILLTVVMMLLFSTALVAKSNSFEDLNGSEWFYKNVDTLVNDGKQIIKGYPDGTFRPGSKLTRDQFITMIVRSVGFELDNASGYWAQNYINKAIELGFILEKDFDDYTMEINREEMSMIVVKAVEYVEGEKSYTDLTQVYQVVKDSKDFSIKYENFIMKSYKLGIITGYPDFMFRPKGVLTRAEASAIIVRFIDQGKRIAFDFDALYEKLYPTDLSVYLKGGSHWVDPLKVDAYKNFEEDRKVITSDISLNPSKYQYESKTISLDSQSDLMGALTYSKEGAYSGHLEDFERLLLRRIPSTEVKKVMDYLSKKKNVYSYLPHDEVFFYLDNDRYLVRIDEVMLMEGTDMQAAVSVNFNIWYRDQNFIKNREKDITQIMPNEDIVIYR